MFWDLKRFFLGVIVRLGDVKIRVGKLVMVDSIWVWGFVYFFLGFWSIIFLSGISLGNFCYGGFYFFFNYWLGVVVRFTGLVVLVGEMGFCNNVFKLKVY